MPCDWLALGANARWPAAPVHVYRVPGAKWAPQQNLAAGQHVACASSGPLPCHLQRRAILNGSVRFVSFSNGLIECGRQLGPKKTTKPESSAPKEDLSRRVELSRSVGQLQTRGLHALRLPNSGQIRPRLVCGRRSWIWLTGGRQVGPARFRDWVGWALCRELAGRQPGCQVAFNWIGR